MVSILRAYLVGQKQAKTGTPTQSGEFSISLCLCLQRHGCTIAAGVLCPVFGLLLSPMIAAAAMGLGSVPAIGNALRPRSIPA